MSYFRAGDADADCNRLEVEQRRYEEMLPRCSRCGKTIFTEKAVYYNGQYCCKDCEVEFWKDVIEDFMVEIEVDEYG